MKTGRLEVGQLGVEWIDVDVPIAAIIGLAICFMGIGFTFGVATDGSKEEKELGKALF